MDSATAIRKSAAVSSNVRVGPATGATLARRVKTSLPAEYRDGGPTGGPVSSFLGLFSIGLGLAELLRPRDVARGAGADDLGTPLLKAYGVREIACGVGILASRRPSPWLWARVAGDAVDLATLVAQLGDANPRQKECLLTSLCAVGGITVLDVLCARKHSVMQRGTCRR